MLRTNRSIKCDVCYRTKPQRRVEYQKINERFEKRGWKLLTTREQFDRFLQRETSLLEFKALASCGHERICSLKYIESIAHIN